MHRVRFEALGSIRNAAKLAEAQVKIAPIELAPGRMLETANRFLVTDDMSDADVAAEDATGRVAE